MNTIASSRWLRRRAVGCSGCGLALRTARERRHYPSQDIRLICAFPAGSGADVLVRYFAEKLRPLAGRNVIVENKAGAGGNIATEYVARAKPDGYTIFVHAGSAVAANMHLFKNPPVDVGKAIAGRRDHQPPAVHARGRRQEPYKTVAELTAAMKTEGRQGELCDRRTTGTVMGELYKHATGVKAVEVNYKTAPDFAQRLASGTLDYGMHDPVFALSQAREGRLRILAVSTGKRLQAVPDLPTMTEPGVPMDLIGWCRHGAGRHAEADRRQDQRLVHQIVSRPTRPRNSSTASAAIRSSTRPRKARRCS